MGAYLSAPVTEKRVFDGEATTVRYGGSAMQGWRRSMEDAHFVHPTIKNEISVFGVFDGHGGCEVARFCEKYLPTEISTIEGFPDNMELALTRVFHRMDEMLKDDHYRMEIEQMRRIGEGNNETESTDQDTTEDQQQQEQQDSESTTTTTTNPTTSPGDTLLRQLDLVKKLMFPLGNNNNNSNSETTGSSESAEMTGGHNDVSGNYDFTTIPVQAGATAIVAVLKGKELYVANAGDSRGVLCKATKAIALSQDHKPGLDTERLRIEAAGGFLSEIAGMYRVNGNLNLSRAIGDLRYKSNMQLNPKDQIITAEPDIMKVMITKEDKFFVLACDGVWDVMDNQQVIDFVLKGFEKGQLLSDIASALLDNCLAMDPKTTRGVGCDNMTCLIVAFNHGSRSLDENHKEDEVILQEL
eukprot:g8606.t1